MLDPRRLAVLREFATQGTVARTADALDFTPSAISQQLAALQREAGVELVRRSGRRLELTDAGRALVREADGVLAHLERVQSDLAAYAGEVRGTVRVAAFETAAIALVVPALRALREAHPGLRAELHELEAEASLPLVARGGLDVVVAEEYEHAPRPRDGRLHRDYLPEDEMLVALPAGHPAAEPDGPIELSGLADAEWATPRAGTAYAEMFERLCRSVGGFEPAVRHRVNDLGLLLELVTAGCAALVPALGGAAADHRVGVHPLRGVTLSRAIFVAVRASDRSRPSTRTVVAAIGEAAARAASSPAGG
jgi:DNA-binding transcriptional LysR family regulator